MGEVIFAMVQRQARTVSCPLCGGAHLDVVLRCDLEAGACAVMTSCDRCHALFVVDAASLERARHGMTPATLVCDASTRRCELRPTGT